MEYVALAIFFVLAAGYLTAFGLTVSSKNGFKDGLTEITTGQLTGQTVERKAPARRFSEEKHKKTVVTYTYYVNNVAYQCECILLDRYQAVPASTRVVYQRKQPQMAYLPEFEQADVKGLRIFYLCAGVFFLMAALLYLFIGL